MYTIVVKQDKSISTTKTSPTVIGDSLTKSFQFILPNVIEGDDINSYVVVSSIIDSNNNLIDFAILEKSSNYNGEYSTYLINNTNNTLSYSNYLIALTFYNINTREKFTIPQKATINVDNNPVVTAIENNGLSILQQIDNKLYNYVSEMTQLYKNTKALADKINSGGDL